MLWLVLGICCPDRAVYRVQSDQRLSLLLLLRPGHWAPGRGKTGRTGQGGRRRGGLTIDIEPPVTDQVQLVEDGSVRAEKGIECVMICHTPPLPTDMKHLTTTGGRGVSKVAWKYYQIEKSTQYFNCQTGGKTLAICESLLELIDPCSGPLSQAGCGEKFAEILMSVCLLVCY